jgi:hypothetical protein
MATASGIPKLITTLTAEERLDGLGWVELVGDQEGLEHAADAAELLCD